MFQQQILRVKDQDSFPMILVANKCDLEFEREVSRNGKSHQLLEYLICRVLIVRLSSEEGRNLAQSFRCPLIETSAKLRINVDEAFSDLVREIRRYNKVGFSLEVL